MKKISRKVVGCAVACGCIIAGFNVFAYTGEGETFCSQQQDPNEEYEYGISSLICKIASSVTENRQIEAFGTACKIFENLMNISDKTQLSDEETYRFINRKLYRFNNELEITQQEHRENLIIEMLRNTEDLNVTKASEEVKLYIK